MMFKIIGTIWGIIACLAIVYGLISPLLELNDNEKRFNEYK